MKTVRIVLVAMILSVGSMPMVEAYSWSDFFTTAQKLAGDATKSAIAQMKDAADAVKQQIVEHPYMSGVAAAVVVGLFVKHYISLCKENRELLSQIERNRFTRCAERIILPNRINNASCDFIG